MAELVPTVLFRGGGCGVFARILQGVQRCRGMLWQQGALVREGVWAQAAGSSLRKGREWEDPGKKVGFLRHICRGQRDGWQKRPGSSRVPFELISYLLGTK